MRAAAAGIDRGEARVERGPPEPRRLLLEPGAQRRVAAGRVDDAVQQRAQVQPGAARDDGQPAARGDVRDGRVGERGEARRVHPLPRLGDVDEVVRRAPRAPPAVGFAVPTSSPR